MKATQSFLVKSGIEGPSNKAAKTNIQLDVKINERISQSDLISSREVHCKYFLPMLIIISSQRIADKSALGIGFFFLDHFTHSYLKFD